MNDPGYQLPRPLTDCEDTPIFREMLIEGWHPDVDWYQRFEMVLEPTLRHLAEFCEAVVDPRTWGL